MLLVSCNGGKDAPNIELIQNMMDQESIKAQDWDPKQPGKAMMLEPPEGTVPVNYQPYKYAGDLVGAEQNLVNPLKDDMSPAILDMGQKNYQIYCGVCHGTGGAGDGSVVAKMIRKPPSLINERATGFNDGRLFHIISDGYGMMSNYRKQVRDEKARWAIVNYIRTLQKKKN